MDWKKAYNNKWLEGKERAEKIIGVIPKELYKVEPYGFLADSTEYSSEHPKERGIPDYKLTILSNNYNMLIETTGTKQSRGNNDLWVRDDKFQYAENHKEIQCWIGHMIEETNLIRFFLLEQREQFNLKNQIIRGNTETFRIIPSNSTKLLNPYEFLEHLEFLSCL